MANLHLRPIRPRERGSAGRAATVALIVVLLLCLGAVIAYLLSTINARRYRLAAVGDELVIERGRFLPLGFEPYIPKAEALRAAYAPLPLPNNGKLDRTESFDDRADLDRALFSLLAGWAREGLRADDPEALKRAAEYIDRSKLLPGLSEQQRLDLTRLRADLAYRAGRRMLAEVAELLSEALSAFKLSLELGTSRPTDADRWIAEIERRVAAYRMAPALPPPTGTPGPAPRLLPESPPAPGDPSRPMLEPGAQPPPAKQGSAKPSTEKWRL